MISNDKLLDIYGLEYKNVRFGVIERNSYSVYQLERTLDNVEVYDANGNEKTVKVIGSRSYWRMRKLIDAYDGFYNIEEKIKQACNDRINTSYEYSYEEKLGRYFNLLLERKVKFCVINNKAYTNIDHSFQKYLENGVSEWIIAIINDRDIFSGIREKFDFIYEILSLDREQLNKIEQKSEFNYDKLTFMSIFLQNKLDEIVDDNKYFAMEPLRIKLNRKINGHDTYIECNDCFGQDLLIDDCDDEYINKMLNEYNSNIMQNVSRNDNYTPIKTLSRIFNVDMATLADFHFYFKFSVCKSIYLAMLSRLMYGFADVTTESNYTPDIMLYNYYVLGEHQGVLYYTDNPKAKVIKLLKKHWEIMVRNKAESDMNFIYHTISKDDILLLEMSKKGD